MFASLVALKLLGPGAAVVVAAVAVAGGESLGLDIGAAELGGGALALFLLREVFNFVKWFNKRNEPTPPAVLMPAELKDQLKRQVYLLEEIRAELHAQRRVCLLGDVAARDHFLEALEKAVTRGTIRIPG